MFSSEHEHVIPIIDFNSVKIYLDILKKSFNNLALFFYDQYGGRRIGVLLHPNSMDTKPFKSSNVKGSMLTNSSYSHSIDNVTLNISALMEDFTILGNGLVKRVILQSDQLFADNKVS